MTARLTYNNNVTTRSFARISRLSGGEGAKFCVTRPRQAIYIIAYAHGIAF